MSIYTSVPRSEFKAIRALAAGRKAKREEKRESLPWANSIKPKPSGSLWKWWAYRCDSLWGKAIRARDMRLYGNICRIKKAKGCTGRNECGYHLISKARGHAIRWHLAAGVAACAPCNDGERLNRSLYAEYHDELFGHDFMNALREISHTMKKYDVPGLKQLAEELQKVIVDNQS
jgi:hypothetical protein